MNRRQALLGTAAALIVGGIAWTRRAQASGVLLSAFEDARGDQYVGGVRWPRGDVFGARIAMRAHGCAIDPLDPARVLFFARRPGTAAFELRLDTMQVHTIFNTPEGRHLAGHGTFSADGSLLFTPEHDYERARGVIAVRDAHTWQTVAEIDSRGIDPHELAWLPDGRRLLVANGGILTHPRSFRRKLNIATMDPSLCVIDTMSGECLEQWRLPDHLLSIRHLAVMADGSAAIGLQYEGDPRAGAPAVAALYTPGAGLQLLAAPSHDARRFDGYVASIAASLEQDVIAAACPYGGGVACWSRARAEYLGFVAAEEPYGVSRLDDGTLAISQRDGRARAIETGLQSHFLKVASENPIRWDDHWVQHSHAAVRTL